VSLVNGSTESDALTAGRLLHDAMDLPAQLSDL
jgi:hypothetical protein